MEKYTFILKYFYSASTLRRRQERAAYCWPLCAMQISQSGQNSVSVTVKIAKRFSPPEGVLGPTYLGVCIYILVGR